MFESKKLIEMIINAVEIEKFTTYNRIASESGISVISLWKIRKNKQDATLSTAQKIVDSIKKLKKAKK
jgi:hypothetical protein